MYDAIILFFSLLFIISGMYFICRSAYNFYVSSKHKNSFNIIIVGNEHDEDLPQKAYSAFVQMNLMNFSRRNEIIVLDLGVSEKIKRECYDIMDNKGSVIFVDEKSLCYFLIERENRL